MGYTDSQGRPELIAQPFIKQGSAGYRTVATPPAPEQGRAAEPAGEQDGSSEQQ
jgi:hypothetical protein